MAAAGGGRGGAGGRWPLGRSRCLLVSVGRGLAAVGVRYPFLWFASSRWSSPAFSALLAGPERGVMSDPGGGGEDGSAGLEVSAVQNVADVSMLQKHLRKLVPLLLEDGGEAPAALEAALEEKSALEQMRKFLSDPQVHTVLVERSTLKGAARPAAGVARVSLPGGGGRRASPSRRHPQQWHRFVCRPQDGRVGWRQRLRAERGGRRPHPGLQCHMSFSVSICVQAPGSGGTWAAGVWPFRCPGGRSWVSGSRRASPPGPGADPDAGPPGVTGLRARLHFWVDACLQLRLLVLTASMRSGYLSPHFTREETEAPVK